MKTEEFELSEVSKKLALKADAMRKKREFDAAEDGDDKKMDRQLTKSGKFKSDENKRRILKKHGDGVKKDLNKNFYKAHFEETILEKDMLDKQGNDKFDRYKRMIRHKQDKYGRASVMDKIKTGKDYKTEEFKTLPLQVEVPTEIRDFNLGLMFRESLDNNSGMLFIFDEVCKQSFHMTETKIPLDIAFIREDGIIESIKQLEPNDTNPVSSDYEIICALEVNRGWFAENNVEVGDEIDIEEAAGEKDACYHKVKSRYSVWPSAYASGALVKCRKKGAANWGNKTKKRRVF